MKTSFTLGDDDPSILYSSLADEVKDPFGIFDEVEVIHHSQQIPDKAKGALFLWGGEDIATSLYGERPNKYVHAFKPSARDIREIAMIRRAQQVGLPIIGICRGAQLMCAIAGGRLMQHIEGHTTHSHKVTLLDEGDVEVTSNSCHHQMMIPEKWGELLAVSGPTAAVGEFNEEHKLEYVPEVVYFPTLNGLGIQSHPEWGNCSTEFVDYCIRKIKEKLWRK